MIFLKYKFEPTKLKKIRYPLYIQTLGMLFAYLSVLLLILFVCFDAQFGFGWEALLKGPAGDRAETIADAISLHLGSSDQTKWNEMLADFGKKYGVIFYVFDIFGNQLAGAKVTLPASLGSHIKMGPDSEHFHGLFPMPFPHPPLFGGPCPPPPFDHTAHRMTDMPRLAMRSDEQPILHTLWANNSRMMPPDLGLSNGLAKPNLFIPPPPPPSPFREHDKFIAQSNQSLWIGMPIRLLTPSFPFPISAFLIAASSNIWQNKLLFDFEFMGIVLFGLILFSVIFWWPFIFNITHKLSALTTTAEKIAEGDFTTLIDTNMNDEIGKLSAAIKTMADRLNGFVQGQKRLLGDISHELITPLARLDMALELFDSGEPNERASLIADIKDEVREMNLMVNELLAFAKAGLQDKQLELKSVNVRAVVEKAVSQSSLAKTIEINVSSEFTVLADPILLLRAISNVLRNSATYAGAAGPISVEGMDTEQTVSITIKDHGPGVPDEILPLLGEPFFRTEFSRSRDSGGIGLGLAIVKSCIECCRGTVTVSNRIGGGLQTEIRLQKSVNNLSLLQDEMTNQSIQAMDNGRPLS